jgi:phosphoribosylaminoimidazolecarboxamide formyltransferase / IMP cyclohydrolase
MPNRKIRRALISVSNKTGVVEFVRELSAMGVEILSTGGTAKVLRDAGIPVKDVSEHTGSPEMMDGRVKTLHPKVHGGLLARRDNPKDMQEAEKYNISMIQLVAVNLYPFEETIANPKCTFEDAIENIDIGGPSMLRSASKGFKDVIVISDPADYELIIDDMKANDGDVSYKTRMMLARDVFRKTSKYDSAIADYLTKKLEE